MFSKGTLVALLVFTAAASVRAEDPPLRDPMQPYRPAASDGREGSAPRRYELSAVLISATRRVAVVNGRRYQQGDRVDGAEIIGIEPKLVHLREGSEDLVVHLSPGRTQVQISQGDSGP